MNGLSVNGEYGYGLIGQNCVDFVRNVLDVAGLSNIDLANYLPLDSLVRDYTVATDFLDDLGVYGAVDFVGDIIEGFGLAGNELVNGFQDAFYDFSQGDFLGGIASIWDGVTGAISDVFDGILDAFGFGDEEDWSAMDYDSGDWHYDDYYWSTEDYYDDYYASDDYFSDDWYIYDEDWYDWSSYYCEFGYRDPIVLDLADDGIDLTSLKDSHANLTAANGDVIHSGWVEADDAILVWDLNANGAADGIGEITFFREVAGARDDLQAPAGLDTDHDGLFDAQDETFDQFLLWTDLNGDGVSQAGETHSLAEMGVESINLSYTRTLRDDDGNKITADGQFTTTDGETHTLINVDLQTQTVGALPPTLASQSPPQVMDEYVFAKAWLRDEQTLANDWLLAA